MDLHMTSFPYMLIKLDKLDLYRLDIVILEYVFVLVHLHV